MVASGGKLPISDTTVVVVRLPSARGVRVVTRRVVYVVSDRQPVI
jgi:hypothetical protein